MKKINCALCGCSFSFISQLARHIDEIHNDVGQVNYYRLYMSNDENCHLCRVCGKPLETSGSRFNLNRGFRRTVHKNCVQTEKYYILKYGEQVGKIKWQEYRSIQAKTNTLEYKHQKYGMSEEEFKAYNMSRAVTLDNMIKRHGIEEGKRLFYEYCEKQKTAGNTEQWFIDKLGEEEGKKKYKDVISKKTNSYETFIEKYGEIEGRKKYEKYINKKYTYTSKEANSFFNELIKLYGKSEHVYYGDKEYGKFNRFTNTYIKYDFVDTIKNKIIEFNGDFFHPTEEHPTVWKNKRITAEDAWKKDRQKEIIAKENGFEIMYIWEHDVKHDRQKMLNECIEFLEKT